VRAAQSDDEPTRMRRLDLGMPDGHVRGVELVDRDDPAGDLQVARGGDDVSDLLDVLDGRAGQPHRRIAQLLQDGCGIQEDVSISRAPHHHADGARHERCHVCVPSCGPRRSQPR
jgi:hypothetical protein